MAWTHTDSKRLKVKDKLAMILYAVLKLNTYYSYTAKQLSIYKV